MIVCILHIIIYSPKASEKEIQRKNSMLCSVSEINHLHPYACLHQDIILRILLLRNTLQLISLIRKTMENLTRMHFISENVISG